MKLIIDISKNKYNGIIEQVEKCDYPDMGLGKIIANGTPLPQGEWIPVSERLPEHTGWYVVTREGMCRRLISIVAFDAKYKNWERGGVVAWTDVKPYTGGDEE